MEKGGGGGEKDGEGGWRRRDGEWGRRGEDGEGVKRGEGGGGRISFFLCVKPVEIPLYFCRMLMLMYFCLYWSV